MPRIAHKSPFFSCLFLALPLCAQTPHPAFEVTSVKPYVSGTGGAPVVPPNCSRGRFTARGSIVSTILWGYGVGPYQFDGKAAGLYDIQATASSPASEAQCRLMVQALLADRFKLALHRETRVLSLYVLSLARTGPKLKQVADSDPEDGVHINGAKTYGTPKGWSIAQLADFLQRSFYQTPVVDRTGLEGIYRFSLNYAQGLYNYPGVQPQGDGPDIFSAVESQLGLKLEQRKEPLDFIVIDHIEPPDPN